MNKPHDLLSSKVQSIGKVQLDFQNPKFSFEGTHYLGWVLDCRENTNETVQNVFLVNLTGRKKCKKVWLYLLWKKGGIKTTLNAIQLAELSVRLKWSFLHLISSKKIPIHRFKDFNFKWKKYLQLVFDLLVSLSFDKHNKVSFNYYKEKNINLQKWTSFSFSGKFFWK